MTDVLVGEFVTATPKVKPRHPIQGFVIDVGPNSVTVRGRFGIYECKADCRRVQGPLFGWALKLKEEMKGTR